MMLATTPAERNMLHAFSRFYESLAATSEIEERSRPALQQPSFLQTSGARAGDKERLARTPVSGVQHPLTANIDTGGGFSSAG
jgi:hypothetical protein